MKTFKSYIYLLFFSGLLLNTIAILTYNSLRYIEKGLMISTIIAGLFIIYIKLKDNKKNNDPEIESEKKLNLYREYSNSTGHKYFNHIPGFQKLSTNKYIENWLPEISLLLIVLLGIYLRFYNLGNLSLTTDEIYQAIAMKSILENGSPLLPNGNYYNRGLTHSYLASLFALYFGANELSVRLPSAIAGVGTIIVSYFLGKELKNKEFGIIIALIICIFPWMIEFSRWGRMYSLLTFLVILSFYSAIVGFKQKKWSFIILAIISSFLAIMTHKFGYITPIIIVGAFVVHNIKFDKSLLKFRYMVLLIAPLLLIPLVKLVVNFSQIEPGTIHIFLLNSYNFLFEYSYSDFFISFLASNFAFLFVGISILLYFMIVENIKNLRDNSLLLAITLLEIFF
ncbi:MAG: glycosyltransferase family 39 protein [Methanolobus sp.]